MQAVSGQVQLVHIQLSYNNIGNDPAFGSQLMFTIPQRLKFVRADVPPNAASVSLDYKEIIYVSCVNIRFKIKLPAYLIDLLFCG